MHPSDDIETKDILKIGIFLAGFFSLAVAIVFMLAPRQHGTSTNVENKARVEQVRAQMERCHRDPHSCIGGFITRTGGLVRRIDSCGMSCQFNDEDIRTMLDVARLNPNYVERIESVTLPTDPGWEEAAVRHARQFVMKRPLREKEPAK